MDNEKKLILSIDAIKDFLSCRRLYDYRHHRRLTNGKFKSNQILDSIVKSRLKLLHEGVDLRALLLSITKEFAGQINWGDNQIYMKEMSRIEALAKSMIAGYVEQYPSDAAWIKPIKVDSKIIVPVRNISSARKSTSLYIEVNPDILYRKDGKLFLLLWETASRIGDNYKGWLHFNIKLPLLAYALKEYTGKSLSGFNVRILRKSFPKENGNQAPLFDDSVILVSRSQSFLGTLEDIYWVTKDIRDCSRNIERNAFYKNSFNCKYYGCEFSRLCRSGDDIREMAKFKIREEKDYGELIETGTE